jgi:hypothetical protein
MVREANERRLQQHSNADKPRVATRDVRRLQQHAAKLDKLTLDNASVASFWSASVANGAITIGTA